MTGKELTATGTSYQILFDHIRRVLLEAQSIVFRAVNTAMVHAILRRGV